MVSLCMVVSSDDAELVPRALESVKFAKQKIIIVQGDPSPIEKAVKGVTIIPTTPKGNADPDREYAVQFAEHPFIFFLDADEIVPELLNEFILDELKNLEKEFDIFFIPFKNTVDGTDISDILGKDYHPRLYRRGTVIWKPQLHMPPDIKSSNTYFLNDDLHVIHARTGDQIIESHKKRHHMLDGRAMELEHRFLQALSNKLSKNFVTPVFGEKKQFRSV